LWNQPKEAFEHPQAAVEGLKLPLAGRCLLALLELLLADHDPSARQFAMIERAPRRSLSKPERSFSCPSGKAA
jgi:hypothetical protein